jgi:hypothetical protein
VGVEMRLILGEASSQSQETAGSIKAGVDLNRDEVEV